MNIVLVIATIIWLQLSIIVWCPIINRLEKSSKARKSDPYAYFELVVDKDKEHEKDGVIFETQLQRAYNKLGLILFLTSLDDALKQDTGLNIIEILETVKDDVKRGEVNAEKDS